MGGFGLGAAVAPSTVSSTRAPSRRRSKTKSIFDPAAGASASTAGVGVPAPDPRRRRPAELSQSDLQQHGRAVGRLRCLPQLAARRATSSSRRRARRHAPFYHAPLRPRETRRACVPYPRARELCAASRSQRSPTIPRLARLPAPRRNATLNAEGGPVRRGERAGRCGRLLVGELGVHSVLLTPPRLATLADAPAAGRFRSSSRRSRSSTRSPGSTFTAAAWPSASGLRPPVAAPRRAPLVVAEDLTDVDNLGALARHAAAFGADALLLSPAVRATVLSQGDPRLARRGVRPAGRAGSGLARRSRRRCAATASRSSGRSSTPGATPLARFAPPAARSPCCSAPRAGSVGRRRAPACDHLVTIPMWAGADSLNVATAGAIFLYACRGPLRAGRRR